MVEVLPRFTFPAQWNMKRPTMRPKDLWVFDFEENYDWDTVWNDAIQINDETVVLVGPPLYHQGTAIRSTHPFYLKETNRTIPMEINELDRACLTVVKVPGRVNELFIAGDHPEMAVKVNQPSFEFAGKKVIVTISKDHPIEWLKQWIDYHRTVHNIDGLLLYNNRSTIYTPIELENSIKRNDMVIKVVDYDVPFGCMGGGDWEWAGKKGNYLPWDSDFSQYVMLEHAKWRYLHCAKLAINADTDELIYIKNTTLDDIADSCLSSNNSVWLYKGTWIEPVDSLTGTVASDVSFNARRFDHYWKTNHSNQRGIGVKWMLNPAKNMHHQWMLHKTTGPHMMTDEIGFGHYLAMNTSWSWPRDGYTGDKSTLIEFAEIKKNLLKWNPRFGDM
jgi:hypothetical protein